MVPFLFLPEELLRGGGLVYRVVKTVPGGRGAFGGGAPGGVRGGAHEEVEDGALGDLGMAEPGPVEG